MMLAAIPMARNLVEYTHSRNHDDYGFLTSLRSAWTETEATKETLRGITHAAGVADRVADRRSMRRFVSCVLREDSRLAQAVQGRRSPS